MTTTTSTVSTGPGTTTPRSRRARATAAGRSGVPGVPRPVPAPEDPALAAAVERVRELALRLWAVRAAHRPVHRLLRGTRCTGCGQAHPCATLRAAAGAA